MLVGEDPLYHLDLVGFYSSFTYYAFFTLIYDFFSHLLSPATGTSEQAGGGCIGGSQGNTPRKVVQKNYLLIEEPGSLKPLEKRSTLNAFAIASPKREGSWSWGDPAK